MKMKKEKQVVIASDHGGFGLKGHLIAHLLKKGYEVLDMGCYCADRCDYPDYAKKLCRIVLKQKNPGILICGTGIGMSIVANKQKGIRAALCHNTFTAQMAREHNDANVLCLGGRVLKEKEAKKIVDVFLKTDFSNEARHRGRIKKMEC